MEDKIFKELTEWQKSTQSVFDNLTTFVEDIKGDLTEEEKAIVDKEMESIDLTDFKSSLNDITKQMNEQMSKFKM